MKRKIIFLALIIFKMSSCVKAQKPELVNGIPLYNLYFLSKYLDAPNLSDAQKSAVNAQFFNLIGTDKIKCLADPTKDDFQILRKYLQSVIRNSPAYLEFENYLKDGKWTEFTDKFMQKTEKQKTFKIHQKSFDDIKNLKNSLNKLIKKKSDSILIMEIGMADLNKQLDSLNVANLNSDDTVLEITNDKKMQGITIKMAQIKKSFDDSRKAIDKEIIGKNVEIKVQIAGFSSAYFKEFTEIAKSPNSVGIISSYYTETPVGKTLQLTNNYVQSIQSSGTSSFKIPSQAQLIDAMAIFLANRAKQEAAIWFMDQLRNRLKNPLVNEAFPQTIKLLTSVEDYKVPNFGKEWRYAISTDFITMPETIADSKWMKVMINDTILTPLQDAIKVGGNVNRLMAQNYTYRDIIQTLYLDEVNTIDKGQQSFFSNTIIMLYAMTNELYSIDNTAGKPSFRLLTFEELNSLDTDQWNYLVDLVHLKYFTKVKKDESANTTDLEEVNGKVKNTFNGLKNRKQETDVFMSKILLNLSQFDKIRNDLEKSKDTEKDNFSKQNFNSAWKIIEQILDNLKEGKKFESISNSKNIIANIENLKTSFKIYENIQSNNFRPAIQETLDLVNGFYKKETYQKQNTMQTISVKDNIYNFKVNGHYLKIKKLGDSITLQTTNFEGEVDKKSYVYGLKNPSQYKDLWTLFKINNADPDFLLKVSEINLDNKGQNGDSKIIPVKEAKNYRKVLKKLDIESMDLAKIIDTIYTSKIQNLAERKDNITKLKLYQRDLNFKYSDQLLKLASFFGDVLSATNSEQLADVISSYSLPPTSYKLKRRVKSSIDFNAYVGGYGAYKFASLNSTFENGWTGGITAPIGITFTWTVGKKNPTNFGLSINVIDLGNIVNHYLTSTETYYKDVHFSEVFSPSVNFIYSIPKSPLVFFLGTSFLPLKSITVDNVTKNTRAFDLTSIQAGVKIDIPLINLYTRDKN